MSSTDNEGASQAKKQKLDDVPIAGNVFMEATEVTANGILVMCMSHGLSFLIELKPLLTPEAVVDLVVASMNNLPQFLPKTFRHAYTPIAAAGTDVQVLEPYCLI